MAIKDRIPVIITKIIDHLCREKDNLISKHGNVTTMQYKSG